MKLTRLAGLGILQKSDIKAYANKVINKMKARVNSYLSLNGYAYDFSGANTLAVLGSNDPVLSSDRPSSWYEFTFGLKSDALGDTLANPNLLASTLAEKNFKAQEALNAVKIDLAARQTKSPLAADRITGMIDKINWAKEKIYSYYSSPELGQYYALANEGKYQGGLDDTGNFTTTDFSSGQQYFYYPATVTWPDKQVEFVIRSISHSQENAKHYGLLQAATGNGPVDLITGNTKQYKTLYILSTNGIPSSNIEKLSTPFPNDQQISLVYADGSSQNITVRFQPLYYAEKGTGGAANAGANDVVTYSTPAPSVGQDNDGNPLYAGELYKGSEIYNLSAGYMYGAQIDLLPDSTLSSASINLIQGLLVLGVTLQ